MTHFTIKSEGLSADKIAAIRTRSLLTDPDAFGEQHFTSSGRSQKDWKEWLEERSKGKDRKLFVLLDEDRYVGMCGVGIDRNNKQSGFIWGVYLLPELRGHGGAELLLQASHSWFMEKGVELVHAKVAAPNDLAIKFYRRMDYEVLGQDGTLREGSSIPVHSITRNLVNKA